MVPPLGALMLAASLPVGAAAGPVEVQDGNPVFIRTAALARSLLEAPGSPKTAALSDSERAALGALDERARALAAAASPQPEADVPAPSASEIGSSAMRAALAGVSAEDLRSMPEEDFAAFAARWAAAWDGRGGPPTAQPTSAAPIRPTFWQRRVENWALYQPPKGGSTQSLDEALLSRVEEVRFKTADGLTLYGWHVQAKLGKPTVLFAHANATRTGTPSTADIMRPFLAKGFGFFSFDYRGYGNSEGSPVEEGLYADLRAASDHLAARGVATTDQIPFGRSLGGAVVAQVATERPFKAALILSAFTSMRAAAAVLKGFFKIPRWVPAEYVITQRYDSIRKMKRIFSPLLIVHGDADELLPYSMGQKLFAAAIGTPRKEFHTVEGGDHNSIAYDSSGEVAGALERFLAADAPVSREALAELHAELGRLGRPWAHGTRTTYLPGILSQGLGAVKPANAYSPAAISVTDLKKPDGLIGAYAFATRNRTSDLSLDSRRVTGRDVADRYGDVNPRFKPWWARFLLRKVARRYEKIRGASDGAPALLIYDTAGWDSDWKYVSRSIPSEIGLTKPIPASKLRLILVPQRLVAEVSKTAPAGVRVLPLELIELEELSRPRK